MSIAELARCSAECSHSRGSGNLIGEPSQEHPLLGVDSRFRGNEQSPEIGRKPNTTAFRRAEGGIPNREKLREPFWAKCVYFVKPNGFAFVIYLCFQ